MAVVTEIPEFAELYAAEDRHFWFRNRNRVIGNVVAGLTAGRAPGYRVLEVGCGNGNVLRVLEDVCKGAEVIGSELHEEGLARARDRVKCRLQTADIYDLPFREPFDLIGMFDVLEHLPDDRRALENLRDAMTPDGSIVLTVPAHMKLWSYVDEVAGHFRRYSPTTLRAALEGAGLKVQRLSQFMMPLVPLMWAGRRVAEWKKRLGLTGTASAKDRALTEFRVSPALNAVMTFLLRGEHPVLARRRGLPVGTSLLAVATKA